MEKHLTDEELVAAFCLGDIAAFGIIAERYFKLLKASAYKVVHSVRMSEDIAQETLIQVMAALKRGAYEEKGMFRQWLLTCNGRMASTHRTKRTQWEKRHVELLEVDNFLHPELVYAIDPHMLLMESELRKSYYQSIERLAPVFRESLMLRQFDGLSYQEIADQTGVSINTTRTRLRLGSLRVREYMQKAHLL